MTRRAVFLDRDGVVNRVVIRDGRPYPPTSPDAFVILPGVPEAIRDLKDAGFLVVVVTNQPDVATGTQRREVVEAMHARLRQALGVDDVRVCYHVDADGCVCRKPKPGMLYSAAAAWGVDLPVSFMVGDRWRDIEAGRAAGCTTVWIRSAYDERAPEAADHVVGSLPEAIPFLLQGSARPMEGAAR